MGAFCFGALLKAKRGSGRLNPVALMKFLLFTKNTYAYELAESNKTF
ncbi:hypothetical protein LNTAR_19447 [Lentisphaera araneosa HTCC2155]|jgi:hypothetical protein|uniref:Uncharacterized protein n=1 Tax=Lentisphaera araneosa HTCC2155 TaxID=313628 RepID=A6DQV5_9BACT|nr:hypothetical protein LNTAR_19447 [Lentisphaera araneosa HTCC2155]